MKKIKNKLLDKRGEGYIDTTVYIMVVMIVIAFAIKLYPVFIVKDQLNELAKQTLREAQLEGKVNIDYSNLAEAIGLEPDNIEWEATTISSDKVQFYDEIMVSFDKTVDIGFFSFGSFPIPLKGRAKGRSEVYWK